MLPEIKQKLDALRVEGSWSELLIKHSDDNGSTIGIHHIYGVSEDSNGNKLPGVTWLVDPIIVSDDLPTLKNFLEKMLTIVNEKLITTEEELTKYNEECENRFFEDCAVCEVC